jgi:hypothetical protein
MIKTGNLDGMGLEAVPGSFLTTSVRTEIGRLGGKAQAALSNLFSRSTHDDADAAYGDLLSKNGGKFTDSLEREVSNRILFGR